MMKRRFFFILFILLVLQHLSSAMADNATIYSQHSNKPTSDEDDGTPSKFDWDIYKLNITVAPTVPVEVFVHYNISNRESIIALYEYDCKTPILSEHLIEVNQTYTPTTTAHGILQVALSIGEGYEQSTIWHEESTHVGFLDFCVRVDLLLVDGHVEGEFPNAYDRDNAISVNFRETKVSLKATVGGRMEIINNFGQVQVSACQCEWESRLCVGNDTVVDSLHSNVYLCMESNYPHVLFVGVGRLDFLLQNKVMYSPIQNGIPNTVTAISKGEQNRGAIVTRLGNRLVNTVANLDVQGIAILEFDDGRGGRQLGRARIASSFRRLDEDSSSVPDGFFQLNMSIDTTSSRPLPWWIFILCGVMALVALYVYVRRMRHQGFLCLKR